MSWGPAQIRTPRQGTKCWSAAQAEPKGPGPVEGGGSPAELPGKRFLGVWLPRGPSAPSQRGQGASLSFGFLLCKMGILTPPHRQAGCRLPGALQKARPVTVLTGLAAQAARSPMQLQHTIQRAII